MTDEEKKQKQEKKREERELFYKTLFKSVFDPIINGTVALNPPFIWGNKKSDFYSCLKDRLQEYEELVKEAIEEKCKDLTFGYKKNILNKVIETKQGVLDIVLEYLHGSPHQAQEATSKLMEKIENYIPWYNSSDLDSDKGLWRIRTVGDHKDYDCKDMFHIPYDLRSKVSATRYSIPGIPCLYLSESLELAESECLNEGNNPYEIASVFYPVLSENDPPKILDMTLVPIKMLLQNGEFLKDVEYLKNYLVWYPVLLACSFVRRNRADKFAEEYIVPQQLMEWLLSQTQYNGLKGVAYFSCFDLSNSTKGINYAFISSGDSIISSSLEPQPFCPVLAKSFKASLPVYRDHRTIGKWEESIRQNYEKDNTNAFISLFGSFNSGFEMPAEFTVPDTVLSLGRNSFELIRSIKVLNLSPTLRKISNNPFQFLRLQKLSVTNNGKEKPKNQTENGIKIEYDPNNDPAYAIITGKTYNENDTLLALVPYYEGTVQKEIKTFTVPTSIKIIRDFAFSGCQIGKITLHEEMIEIAHTAFEKCKYKEIKFEKNPIGNHVFASSYHEENPTTQYHITIPNSVTSIDDRAFSWCRSLTSITIPNSVTTIGSDAFSLCGNLTSITIPDGVTSISDGAFYCCEGLTSITIPNSVTTIDGWAFWDCRGLKSIIIPNSVATIGNDAFSWCLSLTSIQYQGTEAEWNAIPKGEDAIPSGVQIICTDKTFTI